MSPIGRPLFRTALVSALAAAGLFAFAVRATAAAPVPRELPPDEVLRLLESASGVEAAGKQTALAGGPFTVLKDSTHSYDAIHYRLDVTPSRTSRHVDGVVTLKLVVRDPGFTTVDLHQNSMTFLSVKVNGSSRSSWSTLGDQLFIPVCENADCPPHDPGDTLTVELAYSVSPTLGYYHYARNGYTLAEPYEARYWWPCYDEPSDKATLDVYATVPDTNQCYSNGLLIDVANAAPGMKTWHWQETHPIATYLVSVAVANYWIGYQDASGVPVWNVAFPEDSTKAKADYSNVPTMINTFSALWAPYPFDKYGQATVDPFGPGGMEHQTMTTLRRSLLRGDKLYEYVWAHELAHMWWGDWVTCVDFRDIWLNEGFASYGEARWKELNYGVAKYDSTINAQMNSALTADNNFRYALYDPPPNQTFGTTIYQKGSVVLHMLRRILGDSAFNAGMTLYGQTYAYGTATTRDFQHAMEDASGQPLDWFFDEWVFAAGIPTYSWAWWTAPPDPPSPGQTDVGLWVRQVQTNAPLYRMPIEFRISRVSLPDTFVVVNNDAVASQAFAVRVNGTPTAVAIDPRKSILKRVQSDTVDAGDTPGSAGTAHVELAAIPNPARSAVALRGSWIASSGGPDQPQAARFAVYDASGRLVRDLGEVHRAGNGAAYVTTWDRRDDRGSSVGAGVYFVRIVAGTKFETKAVVLLD